MASMSQESQYLAADLTNDVTILSAPGASTTRMVPKDGITIYNNSGGSVTITVQKKITGGDRVKENFPLSDKDTWTNSWFCNLDATTSTLEIFLASAISSGSIDIDVDYRDEAQ